MGINNLNGTGEGYKTIVLLPDHRLVALSWQDFQLLVNSKPDNANVPFGTCSFGVGSSFLISLLTNYPESSHTSAAFLAVCIVGYVLAIFFFYNWWRKRTNYKDILTDIGKRFAVIGENQPHIFELKSGKLLTNYKDFTESR